MRPNALALLLGPAFEEKGRGSRSELARILRVSQPTVGRWASGATVPSREYWTEIETFLDLDAGAIDQTLSKAQFTVRHLAASDIELRLSALEKSDQIAEIREILQEQAEVDQSGAILEAIKSLTASVNSLAAHLEAEQEGTG